MKTNFYVIMAAALLASACNSRQAGEKVPAIDLANLDTTVAPGQDFYAYATNGWQKNHPLKKEYSRYGSFDILRENNEIRLNDLFKGLAQSRAKKGSVEQKIADLYTMGLDSVRLNNEGAAPVLPYLQELEAVDDAVSFAQAAARMSVYGDDALWGTGVDADLMDSDNNVLYLGQSGLGLGNRDYYLNEENAVLREGYQNFLTKVFTLAGYEDAAQRAADAMGLEMAIAVPYWSMVRQRDIQAQYNPMSFEEIFAAYQNLHLDLFFQELGIAEQE
ncbi:MAG: M13 family peptidase, partial [Candidatus Cryptobacteroides sp.]